MGIIGAIDQEITILRSLIKNCKINSYAGFIFYKGKINNVTVTVVKSGVGKTVSSIATTLLIILFKTDTIINIGSAGRLDIKLNIGDIVISSEVRYHDVNVTTFGYKIGQIPKYPEAFIANSKLVEFSTQCISLLKINFTLGLICTGDSFINNKILITNIKSIFPKAIAVDMESASIGQVCYQFNIPFIIIRCISDFADEESYINFNKFLNIASRQFSLVISTILDKISSI
ncbi:5'-methylthioadenosine/S-adenosylhomocysteine nucleosidase [Candidatus Providencia siddallii]|uniref:5'-methylthioadenosine/S-adenosylhomocysteine nucleosidase n=1 Tax=Candidatus Providencia siddallii TaxID=1715285 RepID=A0A0M6W7W3_9GAMM|nr:5'-methylthioadenosine/S-adenosylhomocysteine nucleosidase [Candidatus Providencia siddallii]